MSRAARTARNASSPCARGAPNNAMAASPMCLSITPPIPIDGRVDDCEETLQQGMDLLRVQLRREPGIADDVAEHDSDRPSVTFTAGVDLGDSGFASA